MAPSERELPRFDPTMPNEARVLDFIIGGKDHFAVDREAADKILEVAPDLPLLMSESRKCLGRMVRFLAQVGIRQFVDIGCGLPTRGNVHEIAQAAAPGSRVVYVDNDPVVVAHAQALLVSNDDTSVVQADARDVEHILAHPGLTSLIDLEQPVAFLLVSLLQGIHEDDVATGIVKRLRDAMAPGSHLAIAHAISDTCPEVTADLWALFRRGSTRGEPRCNVRNKAEIDPYFDGLELVEPGVVHLPAWRPDPGEPTVDPESVWVVGGIGRKN
ncbi:SAM-dependent methyltransferase [Actinomadura sp. HBU206391]|uniref:SAM-dependent methyltransferase n=1 Tax=Actinomadura sp. HBU206391 TaxID=2731692 RepID=UPI00164F2B75|nr:SAM-dependent methyltransferase [Actinomadura sp. HBU206391]MBC6457311.1 SAM-dependent methyltransferase [Actinomadura sp. HBU206391]